MKNILLTVAILVIFVISTVVILVAQPPLHKKVNLAPATLTSVTKVVDEPVEGLSTTPEDEIDNAELSLSRLLNQDVEPASSESPEAQIAWEQWQYKLQKQIKDMLKYETYCNEGMCEYSFYVDKDKNISNIVFLRIHEDKTASYAGSMNYEDWLNVFIKKDSTAVAYSYDNERYYKLKFKSDFPLGKVFGQLSSVKTSLVGYLDEENLPYGDRKRPKAGCKGINSLNGNEILTFPAEATRTKVRVHGLIYKDAWSQSISASAEEKLKSKKKHAAIKKEQAKKNKKGWFK